MQTLMLDENWDLTLDGTGRIAVADGAYAVAQSAANAVRLFVNDAYFDAQKGIPHFEVELGKDAGASQAVFAGRVKAAALAVEGVADCEAMLEYDAEKRQLGGSIIITLADGSTVVVEM